MSQLAAERIAVDNDPTALYLLSMEQQWGDGLPLIPPTDERVEAMLAGAALEPHDIVLADTPPRHGVATAELVAINAVMAGCEPAALPLVVAALQAMAHPAYNGFGLSTTTGSVTPMLIVNGPARDALGIDYRAGCLGGAGGRGSSTIGRAVQLCLRNIGGLRAGDSSRTVFGQPARVGLCFGEWEERSPWPSLAQRRGFEATQDVVTVHGGMGTVPLCDVNTEDDRELAFLIAKSIAMPMTNLYITAHQMPGETVVLLNPMWAERFGRSFPRVEDFQAYLHEHAWNPIESWPSQTRALLHDRHRVDARGRVHAAADPGRIVPVVCGGLGNLHANLLPSWGESEMQTQAAARAGQARSGWTPQAVAAAVAAAREVVRADGADVVLVQADAGRGRLALRLDVTRLNCDIGGACLLPGRFLQPLMLAQVQQHLPGELELQLEDPRE